MIFFYLIIFQKLKQLVATLGQNNIKRRKLLTCFSSSLLASHSEWCSSAFRLGSAKFPTTVASPLNLNQTRNYSPQWFSRDSFLYSSFTFCHTLATLTGRYKFRDMFCFFRSSSARALSNFFLLRFLVVPINNKKQQKTQLFIRVWSSAARALTRRWESSCSTHFASTLALHSTLRLQTLRLSSSQLFSLVSLVWPLIFSFCTSSKCLEEARNLSERGETVWRARAKFRTTSDFFLHFWTCDDGGRWWWRDLVHSVSADVLLLLT